MSPCFPPKAKIQSSDAVSDEPEAHQGTEEPWRRTVMDAGHYHIAG